MNNETYNGWTNRETWLISLHFNPSTMEDLDYIKEHLEELESGIDNMFLSDYINFGRINWHELEEHVEEMIEEELMYNN